MLYICICENLLVYINFYLGIILDPTAQASILVEYSRFDWISLIYNFRLKTSTENAVKWYNQLSPECVTYTSWLRRTIWLRFTSEVARLSTFICGSSKMQNYFCKLHIITNPSICNLRSEATRPRKFIYGMPTMQKYLRKLHVTN